MTLNDRGILRLYSFHFLTALLVAFYNIFSLLFGHRVEENVFVAVLCPPRCTEHQPCIRKCCRQDSVLFNSTCTLSNRPWTPHLYASPSQPVPSSELVGLKMNYQIGRPKCDETYEISLRDEPDEK